MFTSLGQRKNPGQELNLWPTAHLFDALTTGSGERSSELGPIIGSYDCDMRPASYVLLR